MNILRAFANDAHWYKPDGTPMHIVIGSSTGMLRPTNITDARKLGLLPSVTSITRILDKPALIRWKMEQAVLATLTTPRLVAETDDAFVERVLNVEKQHEAEAEAARNLGQDIHAAIQGMLAGEPVLEELQVYVDAARKEIAALGSFQREECDTEQVVIGPGYAGRIDLRIKQADCLTVIDFKTCKTIPRKAYPENLMQLAAYSEATQLSSHYYPAVIMANIYISTTDPGKAVTIIHENLADAYEAFLHCLKLWKWIHNF